MKEKNHIEADGNILVGEACCNIQISSEKKQSQIMKSQKYPQIK